MKELSTFLANNYVWFIIIDVFLIFALIGYLKDPNNTIRRKKLETIKFVDNNDIVEELDIKIDDKDNKALNDMINSRKKSAPNDKTIHCKTVSNSYNTYP